MRDFKDFEDSALFIGAMSVVAIVAASALIASVRFSVLGGAAR